MTVCVSVMGGCPALSIVASTVVVTGWSVPFTASTYAVRSALSVLGSGSWVRTYGSRNATGPVISSTVAPQSPAFMSGASGFQSTVQNDRSRQRWRGGVTRTATALAAPGLMRSVTSYVVLHHRADRIGVELDAVHPDLGSVADALEPEPRVLALAGRRGFELTAVPPLLLGQVWHVGEVRPAIDIRIDAVGDEPGQHGGGERDGMPPGGGVADRGDRVARVGDLIRGAQRPPVRELGGLDRGRPGDGAPGDRAVGTREHRHQQGECDERQPPAPERADPPLLADRRHHKLGAAGVAGSRALHVLVARGPADKHGSATIDQRRRGCFARSPQALARGVGRQRACCASAWSASLKRSAACC